MVVVTICEALFDAKTFECCITVENIATLIDKSFTELAVPWKNCVAFGCDNASVMTGHIKGCSTILQQKYQPTLAVAGCPCHLIHIAAENAARQLPVLIDELLTDIYFYLDKSSKRIQKVREFQQFSFGTYSTS